MNIVTNYTRDKGNTPKDIMMIKKFIEAEGIQEYEKNSINYISEFLNLYISESLEDSLFYAKLAGRNKPTIDDIKLSIKLKNENNFSKKPDLILLKNNSSLINSKSLPSLPMGSCQLILPPVESTLLKNNYHVQSEDITKNIEKNTNKAENWFLSNKIENYTRIKQKGLSLSKKRITTTALQESNKDEIDSMNSYNKNRKKKDSESGGYNVDLIKGNSGHDGDSEKKNYKFKNKEFYPEEFRLKEDQNDKNDEEENYDDLI